jgi:hypothetical protein
MEAMTAAHKRHAYRIAEAPKPWLNRLMGREACCGSRLSKTWPVSLIIGVASVACGQVAPEEGVTPVAQEIQGGTLMGADGIGFAVKIDQTMSDGKRLICSGAFITPHVVLTAAHCTRNYDYGSVITPTTDTVIRYGASFADSQKIAGDEKVGWRELGSTDIGLFRVAQDVTLPAIPKLYRSCDTVNMVGQRVIAYGRMKDGNQAPTPEYYMSPERTVRAVANGVGANGNYLQIDPTTDPGDSGGPWVYGGDRIVAVTHTSEYGSRFCDVSAEIETQVTEWGDTLTFVEDSGSGGGGGGEVGVGGRGGSAGRGGASTGSGGTGYSGGTSNAAGGGRGGSRAGGAGGASGTAGRAGAADSGAANSGAAGTVGSGGANSGGASSGGGGSGGASSGGASSGGASSGGVDTGTGGRVGSGGSATAGSAGRASAGSAGGPTSGTGGTGGSAADTQAPGAGTGGRSTTDDEPASAAQKTDAAGCACRTGGGSPHAPSPGSIWLMAVVALLAARRPRGRSGV